MQRIMTVLIAVCIALFLVIGCSSSRGYVEAPSDNILTGGLVKSGYIMADTLLSQSKLRIGNNDTILVASFVNINNLQESSTLGRMLAEHVASRLSQRGYKVIDMRLRTGSVFMEEGRGEFLLSRDLREVSKNHNAAAVVVGT
jgi:TolB-like protein